MSTAKTRASEAEGTLDAVLKAFGDEQALVILEAQTAARNFATAHRHWAGSDQGAKQGNSEMHGVSWRRACAWDIAAKVPRQIEIGNERITDGQVARSLIIALNRQLRWMLVESYESYVRFVRELFAVLGFLDSSLWNCQHFGNIPLDQVRNVDQEWYRERVESFVKQDITKVLSTLRSRFKTLEGHEKRELHGIALCHWLKVIANFRHFIVHARGVVRFDVIAKKLGKNNGGKPCLPKETEAAVRKFTQAVNGGPMLWLIHEEGIERGTYAQLDSPLARLSEVLCTHAVLLYRMALSHFPLRPGWDE